MESTLLKAQIDHVINQIGITALLGIAVVTLAGFVLWGPYSAAVVAAWCAASYLILFARLVFFGWLKRRPRPAHYLGYRIALIVTMLLSSVIWGAAALLFLDHAHSEEFLFVSLLIAGIVSGSLPSLAAYLPAYLCFVVPTFTLLIYQYLALDLHMFGLLTAIYLTGLIGISISLRRVITNSITIDLKNAELLQAVTWARDEAEQANRAKSLFFAAASHDLRQPLHAMGLLLSTLRERCADGDAETNIILQQLGQSHDALTQLFNSLLEISRLESGSVKATIVHTYLAPTLRTLVAEFKPSADAKGLALLEEWQDCAIRTDPILLNRILRNLLSNAIKFTEHGFIKIRTVPAGDHIELAIIDTGIGIAAAEQENIFQEYYQLGNSARDRAEGIGLGLSVVQKMSRLLQHAVWVESTPGRGTCFTVRIALGETALACDAADRPATGAIHGYNVLVVDDDRAVLQAMQILLRSWNCRALAAESHGAALALLAHEHIEPDIVICDYRLKDGVTGLDAIDVIRTRLQRAIPAILISGDSNPELLRQMRERRLFFLHKPVKPAHLQNAMRQVLASSDHQLQAPRLGDAVHAVVGVEQGQ